MSKIIELLREEHRDIEKLLLILEEELSVFDRQGRPDYEIIQAVISYFQDYPDCCHHPKEDMIFEKLKARDPVGAESIGDLAAEHQHEAERLRRVASIVRNILLDREISRQTFHDAMREFIEHQRVHMAMEERFLFPTAADRLRADDWAGVDKEWSDKRESLFSVAFEERCRSLRDRVLQWAREKRSPN